MKKRFGFVSNSSSTSFCVVGINGDVDCDNYCEGNLCQLIIDALNINIVDDYIGRGLYNNHSKLDVYGDGYGSIVIGFDGEDILQHNTLEDAKKIFIDYVSKACNIYIPVQLVRLLYGQFGD
jgi:hypothetical protein